MLTAGAAVPANLNGKANTQLALSLTNVPAGDDYFLLFLNATHGAIYAISPRFSILASGTPNGPTASGSPLTVSLTGGPDPTAGFIQTFPASGARGLSAQWAGAGAHALLGGATAAAVLAGAALALW
jgi:hypothetical protein